MKESKYFYALIGPSGTGKSPFIKSISEIISNKKINTNFLMYTSRNKRINEIDGLDYYFKNEEYIKTLDSDIYTKANVHGNLQAIGIKDIDNCFDSCNIIIKDLHYLLINDLKDKCIAVSDYDIKFKKIFFSPRELNSIHEVIKLDYDPVVFSNIYARNGDEKNALVRAKNAISEYEFIGSCDYFIHSKTPEWKYLINQKLMSSQKCAENYSSEIKQFIDIMEKN
ncbi:MAG: hypothetical protein PHN56_02335 [Candidatus Nanoarchaeia archaeon]|nr:hypothetical protein [Candidatus Nanoarchaeia archaeon]